MPKIKFGATKEQIKNASGGAREAPKPGMYRAKVLSMDYEEPSDKDPRVHVVFEIVEGEGKGYRIHSYLIPGNEAAVWKYHSFLLAVGLMHDKKLKGELNTDRPQDLPNVMLRTKNETYEGTERAKENGIFALKDDDPEAEADEDEGEEDEDEDEPEGEEEEDDAVDLDELDRNGLKAFIKEQELGIRVMKSHSDDDIRTAISDALGEDDGEPEAAEADGDAEDYNTWGVPDLKGELESRGLKATGPKPTLVKRLQESDEADPFAEE